MSNAMSSLELRHPEDGLLLQYLDGELPKRQSRKIHGHLEACWQCRSEMEALAATVNDCVRYRKHVMIARLPEPPRAWGSLDFDRVEAELATESLSRSSLRRLGRWFSPRGNAPLRWALSGAMVLALAVALVRQLRETPNVQAAALLRSAVAASEKAPHPVKRLRIATSTRQFTRVNGGGGLRPTADAVAEAEIARLFKAAHYDWDDPLSAKAYAAWHDALVRKLDEVATADPEAYKIKTTTTDSELISATLKLRKSDYAPLEGRFEFRNHEWVEMTELVDQLNIPASTVAGATGGMPRQPGVPPGPSSLAVETGVDTDSDALRVNEELQVVAALHQLGADLGEPIELSREGRDVVVSGTAIGPARRQQIHEALDRLPHVAVRFSDPNLNNPALNNPGFPAGTPAHSEPAPARDAAAVEKSKYQARIEQRLGGRPQFERFSGQILDWTDSAMARAYALRRLAQQFPPEAESKMSAADRRTLHTLGREHLAAFQKDLAKIQTTLNPVLTGIGGTAGTAETHTNPISWQSASEQLLATARRAETLQAIVLGVTPAGASADPPSQLLTVLGQLTNDIEQCQRLLSYD